VRPGGVRLVLGLGAALDAVLALALILSTWDGLYDTLDLPKPNPALVAQLGGFALGALAWLLWLARRDAALQRPVTAAAAATNAAAAVTIGFWLVTRDEPDLMVGSGGIVLLAVVAVVVAAAAIAEAVVVARARGPLRPDSAPGGDVRRGDLS
jgi:hypothetical protein